MENLIISDETADKIARLREAKRKDGISISRTTLVSMVVAEKAQELETSGGSDGLDA